MKEKSDRRRAAGIFLDCCLQKSLHFEIKAPESEGQEGQGCDVEINNIVHEFEVYVNICHNRSTDGCVSVGWKSGSRLNPPPRSGGEEFFTPPPDLKYY